MREENQKFPEDSFVDIPKEKWPPRRDLNLPYPARIMRSRGFMVQIFEENGGIRISVNRTMIDGQGKWLEGITWDEMFWIKNQVGFEKNDAVELYPAQQDIVNVANIRHLWVMEKPLDFVWRHKKPVDTTANVGLSVQHTA